MNRPIGVIDSGVGGLTVVREIIQKFPEEDIVYLGDTLRCPYGSKSKEEVIQYVLEIVNFISKQNIKLLILACNTATAYTLNLLKETLEIPVIGVIHSSVRSAANTTKNNKIGLIATEATVNSKIYESLMHSYNHHLTLHSVACPMLVPLIEKGKFNTPELSKAVDISLAPLKNLDIDTLILGCTHYPLIKSMIQKVIGPKIKLIVPGEELLNELESVLSINHLHRIKKSNSKHRYTFYQTRNSFIFRNLVQAIFKDIQDLSGVMEIKMVEITSEEIRHAY